MWDAFFVDLNYLSADLLTGRSIPVLIAVSTLPLDPNLLGTMIMLGVLLGSLATLVRLWSPPPNPAPVWALSHAFSAFLSLSLVLRVAPRIHASGLNLTILPAFCLACQALPERPSTAFTLAVASLILFFLAILSELEPGPHAILLSDQASHAHQAQRAVLALHRGDHIARYPVDHHAAPGYHAPDPSLWGSLRHSVAVVVLAYYGAACPGPFFLDPRGKCYVSTQYVYNRAYCVWPTLSAGMLRAYIYLRVAWFPGNAVHRILSCNAGSRLADGLYLVILLYSAAWACAQAAERLALPVGAIRARMHIAAALLALAFLFRWRHDWLGFLLGGAVGLATSWA